MGLKEQFQDLIKRAKHKYPKHKFARKWTDEMKALGEEEVEDQINHLEGRINALFIDQSRVDRYHRLQKKIDSQDLKLKQMAAAQESKQDEIRDIEQQWKPKLLEAVDKISHKFGEFFAQFNNAQGKTELVCEHAESEEELKYSEWHIDILTKFRDDQPWKRLTSSSQSGGEKSVSTMLYLLSLQQVTTVPFRVVDEINQGMDPVNERRIMQILNFECTPKRRHRDDESGVIKHLPQYFVVTPKLLPRLEYSPCSSVFVIFNGPFQMPQRDWTLKKFVQSQKTLSPPRKKKRATQEEDEDEEEDESESESGSGSGSEEDEEESYETGEEESED